MGILKHGLVSVFVGQINNTKKVIQCSDTTFFRYSLILEEVSAFRGQFLNSLRNKYLDNYITNSIKSIAA